MAVLLLAWGDCRADDQTDRIKALEAKLEQSFKVIQRLSGRIGELERKIGTAPPAPIVAVTPVEAAPSAGTPTTLGSLQAQVDEINSGMGQRGFDFGLPVRGFADVQAASSSRDDPMHLRGFNAGTIDLYLTPQFGNRVRSLIEIAFEYEPGFRSAEIDVERLQLGYTMSDDLTVWAGRFHTPFGLWNTTFHHGANLQTSIYRPRFIDFEDHGGVVPAHSVGLWASGKIAFGSGKLTYDGYVANGPSIRDRELDLNPYTDQDPGKMVGFNLGFEPAGALRGLSVGIHGFASRVAINDSSKAVIERSRLRMGGAYAAYEANEWEVFAEYYRFFDAASAGDRHTSGAGFVQAGRSFGSLTPYARYERASLDPADLYFSSQRTGRSYTRQAVGWRYALDAQAALKFELSRTNEAAANQFDGNGIVFVPRSQYRRAAVQYSIAF